MSVTAVRSSRGVAAIGFVVPRSWAIDSHAQLNKYQEPPRRTGGKLTVHGAEPRIAGEVSRWEGVIASTHRFGGIEFRYGKRELGHIHGDYQADIVFPMEVRDKLVEGGKAEPHHILPHSGWITFRFRDDEDVRSAVELFRLSYEIAVERSSEVARAGPHK
jgi:hypothetical protein